MKSLRNLGILAMTALAVLSLSACGGNKKQSLETQDSSSKVSDKKAKKAKKHQNKKADSKKDTATDQSTKTETKPAQTANSTQPTNSNNKPTTSSVNQTAAQSKPSTQPSTATTNNGSRKIYSPGQAANLIVHAMGYSYDRGQYKAVEKADGYHVTSTENPKEPEQIVKYNGDLYDANGKLQETFAELSKPTQNQPNGWRG